MFEYVRCPQCHRENSFDKKVCFHCGASLKKALRWRNVRQTGCFLVLMSPLILIGLFLAWNYLSTQLLPEFFQGYGVVLVDVVRSNGLVELEVYSKNSGTAEVEVKFSIQEQNGTREVADGKMLIEFETCEIQDVTIPIRTYGGNSVNYNYVGTYIDGKRVAWRKKRTVLKFARSIHELFVKEEQKKPPMTKEENELASSIVGLWKGIYNGIHSTDPHKIFFDSQDRLQIHVVDINTNKFESKMFNVRLEGDTLFFTSKDFEGEMYERELKIIEKDYMKGTSKSDQRGTVLYEYRRVQN